MNRRIFLAAALALAACAAAPDRPPEPAYYVMRHLHTPAGERDPDLTEEGRRTALALAEELAEAGIASIHVSQFRRTRQTAAPLAEWLGVEPQVYDARDTPGLLARLRAGTRPVLVVGHSNTVPDIVAGLGGERPAPLAHEDFGDLWIVARDGTTSRIRIGG